MQEKNHKHLREGIPIQFHGSGPSVNKALRALDHTTPDIPVRQGAMRSAHCYNALFHSRSHSRELQRPQSRTVLWVVLGEVSQRSDRPSRSLKGLADFRGAQVEDVQVVAILVGR